MLSVVRYDIFFSDDEGDICPVYNHNERAVQVDLDKPLLMLAKKRFHDAAVANSHPRCRRARTGTAPASAPS